jgi:hypothetical protein
MTHTYTDPYLPHHGGQPDGHSIDAGNQTLLRQAPMTANEYLLSAVDHIDEKLGKGYAKAHPELIAAFMQASAVDLGTAVIARAIESLAGSMGEITEQIARMGAHLEEGETSVFVRSKEKGAGDE